MIPSEAERKRPPFDLTATLRTVLTLVLFCSIGAAGDAAWATLHPLAGAAVLVVGYGAWWRILAAEQAATEREVKMAEALARQRAPLDGSFDDPGPVSAPWAGGAPS